MVVYLRRSGGQLQYSAPLLMQVKGKDRFDGLAQWIRGHLNDDLSVEAIAEQASLSPRHFTRKFKAAFGITPADFVEELRLDEARWLLVNAGDPVERVAKDVGYANDETFRRAFVRRFGVVPSDYRSRFGGAPCRKGRRAIDKDGILSPYGFSARCAIQSQRLRSARAVS